MSEEVVLKFLIPVASALLSLGVTYGIFKTKIASLVVANDENKKRIQALEDAKVNDAKDVAKEFSIIGNELATIKTLVQILIKKEGL